jgi:hypothetical protein
LRDQLNGVVPVVIGHRVVFGGTRYAVTNAICFSSLWPNDTKRQAL